MRALTKRVWVFTLGTMLLFTHNGWADSLEKNSYAEQQVINLQWDKKPLTIPLQVNQERMVVFPEKLKLGINAAILPPTKLRVQNVDGVLYLLALAEFKATRVKVMLSSGKVVLLDVTASEDDKRFNNSPIKISIINNSNKSSYSANLIASANEDNTVENYSSLIRLAVQSLYSPKELIETNDFYPQRINIPNKEFYLFSNQKVSATPLLGWNIGNYYVTALSLESRNPEQVELDLTKIKGPWLAASVYPTTTIKNKYEDSSRSTLFLVSNYKLTDAVIDNL